MGKCTQKCGDINLKNNGYVCCLECDHVNKCIEEESACLDVLDKIYDYVHRKDCPNYKEDKDDNENKNNANINNIKNIDNINTQLNQIQKMTSKVTIKVRPDKNNPESAYTTTVCFNDKNNSNREIEFKYYLNVCMGVSSHDICKLLDFLGIEYFVVVYE